MPRKKKTKKDNIIEFELTRLYNGSEFKYPYSVSLPEGFRTLINKAPKSITIIEKEKQLGRFLIIIDDEDSMDTFMEFLVKDAKTKKRDVKSQTILDGIMRSIGQ